MAGRYRGVTQRGHGWQISFTLPCGTRCRELVRFPASRKGQEEAHRLRCTVLMEIDKGTFDYGKFFPRSKNASKLSLSPGSHITVSDALKDYLVRAEKFLAKSTFDDYTLRIYNRLLPDFGNYYLAELTTEHVRQWQQRQRTTNKSVNNNLIPLKNIFRSAFEDGLIEKNPLARIRSLPVRAKQPHPFTVSEVEQILGALTDVAIPVANYYAFAFGTGLRTSELLALQWSDINMTEGTVRVDKAYVRGQLKPPKTAAGIRNVRLQPIAAIGIRSQIELRKDECVFFDPSTNRAWRDDYTLRNKYWYPALSRLGIVARNPYQTRHTFASTLLSAGENPLYVAQQMGHSDWGMIRKVYGRWIGN